jgi:diguanylate cyclase (GGDEF)-like protein/PAS domain S-box-containing protein
MTDRFRNIKNTTLLRLSVLLIIVLSIFLFVLYSSYRNKLDAALAVETVQLRIFFKTQLNTLNETNFIRINNLLSNHEVIDAIEQRDRLKLYSLVKRSYDLFSAENRYFKNMHFHTDKTVTILRVHKPEMYNDDLSKIRHIIARANEMKLPESGVEVGLNGIYYRVVQPVFNARRDHIGCVEFGIDPMYFTHLLESLYGDKKLAFVYTKDSLKVLNNKESLTELDNGYLMSDNPDFFREAIVKLGKKNRVVLDKDEKNYLIAPVMELKNYSGETIASLVAAIDITQSIDNIRTDVYLLLMFSLMIAVSTLTVVNLGFNAYIRRLDKTNETLNKTLDELSYNHAIIDKYVIYSEADSNGIITNVSTALCELSQYTKEELIGSSHKVIKHPDTDTNSSRQMWNTIVAGNSWNGDIKNMKKDGTIFWVNANIIPKLDDSGRFLGYSAIRTDITDKKRVEELNITDELTALYNKRYFNQILDLEVRRAQRNHSYLTLAIMDIDFFKPYNDTYGHLKGDKVLKRIAMTIKKSLNRAGDYAFRVGGEEFAIVCVDMNPKNSIEFFEQLKNDIKNLNIDHAASEVDNVVTISIGIFCSVPTANTTANTTYRKADTALYDAKRQGRNRVCVYEDTAES